MTGSAAALARPVENVWKYPRPPRLERTQARLRVVWEAKDGHRTTIADTNQGYRVLETSHPPTYYFPPASVAQQFLRSSSARQTYCEWKGKAAYHDLVVPSGQGEGRIAAKGKIWTYPTPTSAFQEIRDYYSFYVNPSTPASVGTWRCYVDDDEATAQEGDFYGSWVTPEITGGERGFKGGAGTWGW
ncbi:unnamed protein product [Jaminaea pallidilutea]